MITSLINVNQNLLVEKMDVGNAITHNYVDLKWFQMVKKKLKVIFIANVLIETSLPLKYYLSYFKKWKY